MSAFPMQLGPAPFPRLASPPLQPPGSSDAAARDRAALGKAAGEFEALLLNSLWKSMKETFPRQEGEGEGEEDPILESFDDWGMQALSRAAGSAGALGIKTLIMQHLGDFTSHSVSRGPDASLADGLLLKNPGTNADIPSEWKY